MIPVFFGFGAAAGAEEDTTPPTAPPSSPSAYYYGGSSVGVQWTNGDSSASTQVGFSTSDIVDPASVTATVSPGITSYETGLGDPCYWYVRHIRNGFTTAWVQAPHEDGCTE